MTLDHDGKIRMDCSSPYAMASLVKLKDRFDVAFGNDPDSDRHGIVTPSMGLMNPNHLPGRGDPLPADPPAGLAGARDGRQDAGQQQPDRPRGRRPGPAALRGAGRLQVVRARACSTARSASAARRAPGPASCDATAPSGPPTRTARSWTCWPPRSLARTGKDPGEHYQELTAQFGTPYYTRIDAPATPEQKARLAKLDPSDRQGVRPGRRADHRQADPRPRQRRPDRRAEGRRRRTAGSPPGPPAPRTSTRSTPRASATRPTSTPSSREAQTDRHRRADMIDSRLRSASALHSESGIIGI